MDTSLRDAVLHDVQGKANPAEKNVLVAVDPIAWREVLVDLQRDVDTQLAQAKERNAEDPNNVAYSQWRKRTVYYRSCIEKKLACVNKLCDPEGRLSRGFRTEVLDRLERIENLLKEGPDVG